MAKCKLSNCEVTSPKKLKNNGYCDKHQHNAPLPKVSTNEESADLQKQVETLQAENRTMRTELDTMKFALKAALSAIDGLHAHMNSQIGAMNTSSYERDALEQYGRKESGRYVDVEEEPLVIDDKGNIKDTEDCAQVIVDAAAVAGIEISKDDIQRAHRVGRRRKPFLNNEKRLVNPKPRQIIFKMKDYGKRMNIIKSKRTFRENAAKNGPQKFKNAFCVEDLTPLRSKLLWYAKNKCGNKFSNCHTKEGRILAQTSESKPGEWLSLSSPDDFHKHGIDIDIDILNDGLRKIQVLKDVEFATLSDLL